MIEPGVTSSLPEVQRLQAGRMGVNGYPESWFRSLYKWDDPLPLTPPDETDPFGLYFMSPCDFLLLGLFGRLQTLKDQNSDKSIGEEWDLGGVEDRKSISQDIQNLQDFVSSKSGDCTWAITEDDLKWLRKLSLDLLLQNKVSVGQEVDIMVKRLGEASKEAGRTKED